MKKYLLYGFIFLILLTFVFSSYTKTDKEPISLFVPNEMHFVIPELVKAYKKENSGIKIVIQEVSSDEFASLPKKGIRIFDSWSNSNSKAFLKSPLVVIGYRKIYSLNQLKDSSVTIPDPDYNTVGVNVIKVLQNEKIWDSLKRSISYKEKGILCMESVDLGEEDFAILSLADALLVKNASLIFSLEDKKEISVQYRIKNYERKNKAQKDFYKFLHSEKAIKIFEKHGFLSTKPEGSSKSVK